MAVFGATGEGSGSPVSSFGDQAALAPRRIHNFEVDGLVEWDKSAAGLAKSRWPYPTADVVGVIERFTFAAGEAISNREARGRDAISVPLAERRVAGRRCVAIRC